MSMRCGRCGGTQGGAAPPEQAEALAVPTNHSRGSHNGDGRLPLPPNRRQPRPEKPIRSCQLRSLHRPLQNSELMTKGQNLKLKGRATTKESQAGRPQRYKWRRISKSKVVRQASMYQQLRVLREPQSVSFLRQLSYRRPPIRLHSMAISLSFRAALSKSNSEMAARRSPIR